jgi:hypothetical protein
MHKVNHMFWGLLVIFIVYFLLYINFTYAYNVICYAMVHVTWRLCLIISMDTCNNNIVPSVKLHNYYFHFICLTFTSSLFKLRNPFSWIKACLEHRFQIIPYLWASFFISVFCSFSFPYIFGLLCIFLLSLHMYYFFCIITMGYPSW